MILPRMTLTGKTTGNQYTVQASFDEMGYVVDVCIVTTKPFLKFWKKEFYEVIARSFRSAGVVRKMLPDEFVAWYQYSLDRHDENVDQGIERNKVYNKAWEKYHSEKTSKERDDKWSKTR